MVLCRRQHHLRWSGSGSDNLSAFLSTTSGLSLPVGGILIASIPPRESLLHRLLLPIALMSIGRWRRHVQRLRRGEKRRDTCVLAIFMLLHATFRSTRVCWL